MADISFKISGDTPTFVARIYENSDRTTLVHENFVDFSGTCVSFGMLKQNTSYYYSVCDRIGNQVTGTTITPVNPFSAGNKNICMCGNGYHLSVYPELCSILSSDYKNRIIVDPPLANGESVNLNFSVSMIGENSHHEDVVNNSISVYHKPYGAPSYNQCYNKQSYLDFNTTLPPITLSYGDQICYDISTQQTDSSIDTFTPYSKLCLTSISSPVGFTPVICCSSKCTSLNLTNSTTTTTTTTSQPVTVYFVEEEFLNNGFCKYVCSKLYTSCVLKSNQSFRLCFTDATSVNMYGDMVKKISSEAYGLCSSTCCNCVCSTLNPPYDPLHSSVTTSNYSYIDINYSNNNNVCFVSKAISNPLNEGCYYDTNASVTINTIGLPVCGTYVINSSNSISATIQSP